MNLPHRNKHEKNFCLACYSLELFVYVTLHFFQFLQQFFHSPPLFPFHGRWMSIFIAILLAILVLSCSGPLIPKELKLGHVPMYFLMGHYTCIMCPCQIQAITRAMSIIFIILSH